jgi:hypothetical protein
LRVGGVDAAPGGLIIASDDTEGHGSRGGREHFAQSGSVIQNIR